MNTEQIGKIALNASFKVHTKLGPGLLESVYESALAKEIRKQGLRVERQKAIPVFYDGELLDDVGFRADLIIENQVLIELKSVVLVTQLFKKTTWNYLRLSEITLGYLINFNSLHLKDGFTRIVNGAEGKPHFAEI